MKKLLSLSMVMMFMFTMLTGCGGSNGADSSDNTSTEEVPAVVYDFINSIQTFDFEVGIDANLNRYMAIAYVLPEQTDDFVENKDYLFNRNMGMFDYQLFFIDSTSYDLVILSSTKDTMTIEITLNYYDLTNTINTIPDDLNTKLVAYMAENQDIQQFDENGIVTDEWRTQVDSLYAQWVDEMIAAGEFPAQTITKTITLKMTDGGWRVDLTSVDKELTDALTCNTRYQ